MNNWGILLHGQIFIPLLYAGYRSENVLKRFFFFLVYLDQITLRHNAKKIA